jgi:large subunit ribosomal protein L30
MILVIRISGMVEVDEKIEEALFRLRLRRKYSAVLLKETKENLILLKKVRDFIAFGTIDQKTLELLIEKRAQPIKDKVDVKKIMDNIDKKKLEDLGIKPFFRLHPPVGGIDSKKHFGVTKKAVLGDNKEKINDLLRRML